MPNGRAPARELPERPPKLGELVQVRSRRWLVEDVGTPPVTGQSPLVRLACADDDAQGQKLEVLWRYEPDRLILEGEGFPNGWETDPDLEVAGETYYDFRTDLMVRNKEGLTATYNRFHDPDILELRRLHAAMDRAVLDAYGWTDIPTDGEFLLEYEIDEETWSPRRKKPWCYRWPDEVHDEVLPRLLELNAEWQREEVRSGARGGSGGRTRRIPTAVTIGTPAPGGLFLRRQAIHSGLRYTYTTGDPNAEER